MYYTYVLQSLKDKEWYSGAASDLKTRMREHEQGKVRSTRCRHPLRPIYYEACLEAGDAFRRERFLRTGKGKRYLRQRLKAWLTRVSQENKLEWY